MKTVTNILKLSDTPSYEVEWSEAVRTLSGNAVSRPTEHKAFLTLTFAPPKDELELRSNPLGIYFTSLAWSKKILTSKGGQ